MATKTFKTRIKLKYDSLTNVNSFSGALAGEMLLGLDVNKVYAYVGTGDANDNGGKNPLWISGAHVDITPISLSSAECHDANSAISLLASVTRTNTNAIGNNTSAITGHGTRIAALEAAVGNGSSVAGQITDAINALDNTVEGMGVSKTIATLTQADGVIDATFQPISITSSQVNDFAASVKNLIVTGGTEGTIKVNGTEVAVAGLGTAAYTAADAYATSAQGATADRALQEISAAGSTGTGASFVTTTVSAKGEGTTQTVGVSVTTKEVSTASATDNGLATAADVKDYVSSQLTGIVGAMVYQGTVSSNDGLPTADTEGVQAGWTYIVSTAGTYNGQSCEVGDMIIVQSVGNDAITFNIVNGENQVTVTPDGALITAGGHAVTVATVDGTEIPVKVEVTDGAATIASVSNDVVTLKAGVKQGDGTGTIGNSTDGDIVLAKVAKTGAAVDVSIADIGNLINATNVEGALAEIVGNVNTNKDNITANTNAINILNGDENTSGSVAKSIKDAIKTTIAELDSTVTATEGSAGASVTTIRVPTGDFNVLEKVDIKDGKLDETGSSAFKLKKLAATANVNDLIQAENDCIIFDCGSASSVTNSENEA